MASKNCLLPAMLLKQIILSFSTCSPNLFLAAQLRTIKGTQTKQAVLNKFGEASDNSIKIGFRDWGSML